jgi:hypothetical protein
MVRLFSDSSVSSFLKPGEILTSSQLQQRLLGAGRSEANARKMLSRGSLKGDLWRSDKFRLQGNERIYAHKDYWGTAGFCLHIAELVARMNRPGISRCLEVLAREDILLPLHAQKLLASPIGAQCKARYPDYESELEALNELGVSVCSKGSSAECLIRNKYVRIADQHELFRASHARQRVECLLARIVLNQLRQQNVLTWNRYSVASVETGFTEYNGQLFTATGYSFLDPLVRWQEGRTRSCPVFFDVYAGKCGSHDVAGFLQRIKRAMHRGKNRYPALGVIAAKGFYDDAWLLARSERLMTINLRQAFGDEALDVMVKVQELLGQLSAGASFAATSAELGEITSMLKELHANPVVVSIRSVALEAFACCTIQADGWQAVGLGGKVDFDGQTTREVDVYGWRNGDVRLIECKAAHSEKELARSDVKRFFCETVPAYLRWVRSRGDNPPKCIAEMWTTGKITEAQQALSDLSLSSVIEPAILDRAAITERLSPKIKDRGTLLLHDISLYQPKDAE